MREPIRLTIGNIGNVETTLSEVLYMSKLFEYKWTVSSVHNGFLELRGPNDVFITCRTKVGFDLGHLVEIYIDKEYGDDYHNKNVIDVGMSNGDSSIYFAKRGARRVIGVEPDKRSFELAVNNIKRSHVANIVIPLNKALGPEEGEVELIVYDSAPNANSIDENNMVSQNAIAHREKVQAVKLSALINMFNGEMVDLLKIDCEGCEYSVLRNAGAELQNVINIIMEYHHGLQDLPTILKQNGFIIEINGSKDFMGIIRAKRES